MVWIILILAACFEALWAIALAESQGFKKPIPSLIFLVAMALSIFCLGIAMQEIPVGTAYAVWTGLGAALTVLIALARGVEKFELRRIILIIFLISCVAGLKVVG
ncbi:MAG: multidrug efflux SMR transporter [Arcanobacterium sp.]|nr:multidrug efflux SMR transporter [Arcanobacterium sp.]